MQLYEASIAMTPYSLFVVTTRRIGVLPTPPPLPSSPFPSLRCLWQVEDGLGHQSRTVVRRARR